MRSKSEKIVPSKSGVKKKKKKSPSKGDFSTEGPVEQHPPAGTLGGRTGQKEMKANKIRKKELTSV